MKSWDAYWNNKSLNRTIMGVWAARFVGTYDRYIVFKPDDVVLDFGAGNGDVSFLIRNKVHHIYLYDKAQSMSEALQKNFSGEKNMQVVSNLSEIRDKVSVILVNSVIQYIPREEFNQILKDFKRIAQEGTCLVIADIIPRKYSLMGDFIGQLSLGLKYGFFIKLISFAVGTTRINAGMSLSPKHLIKYDQEEILQMIEENGFTGSLSPVNFTYSRKRYTIIAHCTRSGQ